MQKARRGSLRLSIIRLVVSAFCT